MGCYGGAAKTPQLDKLAKSAAVFARHYNQWPVCGPSRASMLGGLRPDSTGIYEIGSSWQISKRPDTHPTMPQYFQNNGYQTLGFGKVYHGKGAGEGYGWSQPPWKLDWTCYVDFKYIEGQEKRWRPAYEIYDGPDSKHNDFQTAEKVIQALGENKDRPFLIAGGFYKPHLPFVAPKKYWDLYSDDEIKKLDPASLPKGAADFMYNWNEISSYADPDGEMFSGDSGVGDKQAREMIHAYYASVSFIDAQVGRILEALEKNGLADKTAVVIWGDHGFHLGDHGRWAKHTQFEQAMRCPLIVRLPGQHAVTGVTKAIVESIDIYPTLCDFAGLRTPDFVEGQSFLPVIEGKSSGKQAAFSQIRPVNRKQRNLMAYSVRTKDFRYVQWREPDNQNVIVWRELYDHRTDPEETISVIDDPQLADVVRQHEQLVLENYSSLNGNRNKKNSLSAQQGETKGAQDYCIGADISFVQQREAEGISWSDDGEDKELLAILKDHGFNWIRLRIFVDPQAENGYSKEGFCNLEHTLQMAKRVKDAGMQLLLDFHYSDNWADPGKQRKPIAWINLHGEELKKAVYDHTRQVMSAMKQQGTSPGIVQIGNEISNGMLWPDGKMWETRKWDVFCELFQSGSKAAKEVDPAVKVMMHLACGGQNERSRAFLDKTLAAGATFDIIGQSYYPKWHGTLDDLQTNLTDLAGRYEQPIIVVEHSGTDLRKIHDIVHGLPNGKGVGAFFWEPTRQRGEPLFDNNGKTKPLIEVYKKMAEDYRRPQNETIPTR